CMTLSGLCPHSFHEELSSHGNARYLAGILKAALLAIMAPIIGFGVTSHAYVLEGQSWPAGTVVVLQLSLGNPGRTLQDGNTSWNNAVAPVAEMWNEQLQRVHVTQVLNASAPCSSGEHLNSGAGSRARAGAVHSTFLLLARRGSIGRAHVRT